MKTVALIIAISIVAAVAASQFISIFVLQPIGAVPDGRTIVITRLTNVNFIDSADGICERHMGGVSILCRGVVLGRIAGEARILLRLPYSEFLYRISTNGKHYDR